MVSSASTSDRRSTCRRAHAAIVRGIVACAQWAPRLSCRRNAAVAISRPTSAGSASGAALRGQRRQRRDAPMQAVGVAQHPDARRHDRPHRAGIRQRRRVGRHRPSRGDRGVSGDVARHPRGARPPPPATNCWRAGWRRAARCSPPRRTPTVPATRAAPGRVHRDAAHVVMRGRAHGDRLVRRVDPGRPAGGGDAGKPRGEARRRAPRAHRGTRDVRRRYAPTRRGRRRRAAPVRRPARRAMKRAPVSSTSTAPSPRTASLTSGIGSRPTSSAVGWNCTNSRSASAAPARAASASPLPIAPAGLVLCGYSPPSPPVASTTRPRADRDDLPGRIARATPCTAPLPTISRRATDALDHR